jgi:AraC-like DNA-binding protein
MQIQKFYESFFGSTTTDIVLPAPPLRRYILAYNFFKSRFLPHLSIYPIPNGLLEVYIHFEDSGVVIHDTTKAKLFKHFVVGLYDAEFSVKIRPVAVELYHGVCLRFTYEGILILLGLKISDSLNFTFDLDKLFDNRSSALIDRMLNSFCNQERARLLDCFFMGVLSSNYKKNCRLSVVYDYLNQKTGRISVDDMAKTVCLSYRTIHRKFQDEMGLCPKQYLKIIRFNNACKLLTQYPGFINMQDIVYLSGYYDQAHFIRDFKSMMKISPCEFFKQSNGKFYLTRPFYIGEDELKIPTKEANKYGRKIIL